MSFLCKVSVVIEESDESEFWLELLIDSGIIAKERLTDLQAEANEITKMMVASRQTVKKRISPSEIKN